MQFKEIIGNKDLKDHLKQTITNDRISHAQMFLGSEGSGGLAMAIAYAQAVFCKSKVENDSCGTCPDCIRVSKLGHPDLHFSYPILLSQGTRVSDDFIVSWREIVKDSPYFGLDDWHNKIDAGNKQSTIAKDEAASIFKKISLKSFEGGYKILIIWLPEAMNISASNKLLKLIEEPPEKTLFLLVSQDQEQIITTIRSRTQIIKIPKPTEAEVSAYLLKKHNCTSEVAENVAHLSERNIALAERLLASGETASTHLDNFMTWMRLTYKRDISETVNLVDKIAKTGREEQKSFLKFCLQMFRQCIVGHYTGGALTVMTTQQAAFLKKFAPFINHKNIMQLTEMMEDAHYHIERNANPKIVFLDVSLKMFAQLKKKM